MKRQLLVNDAVICKCGRYRYRLDRIWNDQLPRLTWVLLNGSTADAQQHDPTIRRVMGFSVLWGFGGCVVVNVYAGRATKPDDLFEMDDPVGPDNEQYVKDAVQESMSTQHPKTNPFLMVGWGNQGARNDRDLITLDWIRQANGNVRILCLETTKEGCPRHPLYLPKHTEPIQYSGRTES